MPSILFVIYDLVTEFSLSTKIINTGIQDIRHQNMKKLRLSWNVCPCTGGCTASCHSDIFGQARFDDCGRLFLLFL